MTAMLISISVLYLVTQTPFIISNYIWKRLDFEAISQEYEYGFYLFATFTFDCSNFSITLLIFSFTVFLVKDLNLNWFPR